jgi:enoyl-CoA hydratase/carnithine racemase
VARPVLDDYSHKYEHIKLDRTPDGILQIQLHSDGGPIVWGFWPHEELGFCFQDVSADPENKVVILTGSGDAFIAKENLGGAQVTPQFWTRIQQNVYRLMRANLDIEAPMIAAVNGPATIHCEQALMCDIVLAADHAYFQDAPHFPSGLLQGDGVHLVLNTVLGLNRARYFMLTGQKLSAREAQALGVVNEVLPAADLLPRAYELARMILQRPPLVVRYARTCMVAELKRQVQNHLEYAAALEGLAGVDLWPAEFE